MDTTPAPPTPAVLRYFGIRHHGPGCARSLLQAFAQFQPDCVLVEGPPEAEPLLGAIAAEGMQPPVALLSYCPDALRLAVYHPFAEFSPEWQALRWAQTAGVPARFIDLPLTHHLAMEKERRAAMAEGTPLAADAEAETETETETETDTEAEAETEPAIEPPDASAEADALRDHTDDPLDWLAHAAGYTDGEAWWNHMVEERGDGGELFAAIDEAMTTLRAEAGDTGDTDHDPARLQREALREAHMRQCVRAAQKEGFARIAVVCGAWHLGGLQARTTAKADQALLKGLPKVKVQCTWVPWTYRHLTRSSGYGAGITAPGWYDYLWHSHGRPGQRAVGWLARVAQAMRAHDLDCSSAHLIEASRLADALAALRGRPAPSLEELDEATRTVMAMGDGAVLQFLHDTLLVGDRFGSVPADMPTVPLQRDLEQAQKSLRLKPEALHKTLDLDLRTANDLARSHLLHRLNLLDIPWGELAQVGRSVRGTFHEIWALQWQPEFVLRLIEASLWGQTVAQAATARAIDRAAHMATLAELSALVDSVLLADLDSAVAAVTQALQDRAAVTGDAAQLLAALPPLANVFRYGNVRQTDATLVAQVLDGLVLRAAIGLPLAAASLDDRAAEALRDKLLGAHAAVLLRQGEAQTQAWQQALAQLASLDGSHALLQGVATRLLMDAGTWSHEHVAQALSLHLSAGADADKAAAWLDGFLNRNAVVLLHDAQVWQLVDAWLAGLSEEHFVRVLPLVRRTFSLFEANERSELGRRASQGVAPAAAPPQEAAWDATRARMPLPVLRQLLGIMT